MPRAAILLPLAFSVHLAEEWFGGFLAWTPVALGYEIGEQRFVLINATAFVLFVACTAAAFRYPKWTWLVTSLAVLLGLNGVLHALGTLAFGLYSPGVVTGLLLYVPLSIIVLRTTVKRLPATVFAKGVVIGLLIYAVVPILAFV